MLPTLTFAEAMATQGRGAVVNVSSMATQALSGVMGYSVAKAGIDNFTRWMAVDMARRFGEGVRGVSPPHGAIRSFQLVPLLPQIQFCILDERLDNRSVHRMAVSRNA